jgi:DnaJ family protein C protein 8
MENKRDSNREQGETINPVNNNTNNNSRAALPDDLEKQAEQEMRNLINSMKEENQSTPEAQIKRLINTTFINPYEIFSLTPDASEEDIKRKYRAMSLLVHPDKNQDPNAADAFHSNIIFNFST